MGMGIAFTFLLLVALLAPVAWLVWWAADSLGRRPVALAPAGPAPAGQQASVRSHFDYPQPADLRLPGRPDSITVYRAGGTTPVAFCQGPDAGGRCPIPTADGTVPCAGCVLVLPQPIRGSRDWHIPSGYLSCVAGSYTTFRQPVK